jgi:hypothetical protein
MPYAAGVFTLVAGNPVVTGTIVSSTWANNTFTDVASGLSTCILKDGTQTTTAPIPFAQGVSAPFFWGTGIGSYGKVSKRMSADLTVAVTAMTTVTALSLSLAANEEWHAEYVIAVGTATAGVHYLLTLPAGAVNLTSASPWGIANFFDVTVNATVPFQLKADGSGSKEFTTSISLWVLNGANPGTAEVKFGQSTATTSGLLFRKGSHMWATRLA